jgi:hypothetical protein
MIDEQTPGDAAPAGAAEGRATVARAAVPASARRVTK